MGAMIGWIILHSIPRIREKFILERHYPTAGLLLKGREEKRREMRD